MINRLPAIAAEGLLADALEQPTTSGDRRWDALLAAAIRGQHRRSRPSVRD